MKNLSKLLLIGAALVVLALVLVPAIAQDTPEPGHGGIIIEGNFGGDPATFNPIICTDTACQRIYLFMYPNFIGVDPATALFQKGRPDSLVLDWDISDDGTVYTFHLRDDWNWTDGTPVTSADYLYSWNAIKSGVVDTPLGFVTDSIANVEAPDPYTVVVTFNSGDCTALNNAGYIVVLPSHALPADFSALNDDPYNTNPTVTGGVFSFGEFRPAEQVSLVANQDYPGAINGAVFPEGFIYKVVPDQTVLVEQFLAGETNVIDGPPENRRSDIHAAADAGDVQEYSFPGNSWDYLSFNLADPTNPQNALDADGNPIDQGHHPLFGDVRVRQAIAKAINVDEIIQGATFGEATRMTSFMIPASWAYDSELPPIAYDPDAAAQMLDEAGWRDEDGDGVREAHGAMYAADGTPFTFTLYTNEGNTRRTAVGTIVQDQLKQIGINVNFQTIDFNTLLDIQNAQTFDAIILGWQNSYPDDPDLTQLFTPSADVVGSGSNFTSYNNPEVTDLNAQAKAVPGCDPADRAPLYHQIQEIMQQDLPYVPLYARNGMYAARSNVHGFDPYPSQLYWNVDTWTVAQP